MPIYEYECDACHYRFDRREGFDAEPVTACPRCHAKARRVIHSVPVIFKGSGFYSTDHGRGHRRSGGADGKKETPQEAVPANQPEKTPSESTDKN